MGKQVDSEVITDSQYAIGNYMNFKDGNDYLHEARVIVSSRGKNQYNSILKVIPRIETNYSSVNIIGDTQFELDYNEKYTNKYAKFVFRNGTLLIICEDKWGNLIEIDISSV